MSSLEDIDYLRSSDVCVLVADQAERRITTGLVTTDAVLMHHRRDIGMEAGTHGIWLAATGKQQRPWHGQNDEGNHRLS